MAVSPDHGCQGSSLTPGIPGRSERPPPFQSVTKTGDDSVRAQVKRFQGRLPENTDPNEWVEYVLGGIRRYPIKLASLKPDTPRKHGPFNVVVLKIALEGAYPDLDKLIGWLESNDRLFRIDSVQLEPHRSSNGDMNMVLVVLGVMG
ncbi:MAG TPA: GspMb/PilO family protein [Isosphaeraceae bacterium]|nr:GspMb/PilO family protein [Isosphaeraceae bacterium]